MRASQFFLSTLKEAPSEAELASHRLMLRAGLIRRLASGLYTWMPLGLRVLRKVEAVVRQEMNAIGGIELLMPAVQPAELWQESGRWEFYGPELLRLEDRHQRNFCFGPTHEEVVTDVVRREIRSYRQLPLNFYQIQTKFRDEIRPRFGVMRAREFLMKDAYSFHADRDSLLATYANMYDAYHRVFTRLGLKFRAVAADTGAIGGSASHEFHVLADSGEDAIAFCPDSDYAANLELAEALAPAHRCEAPEETLTEVATPDQRTVADLADFLKIPIERIVKTLLVAGETGPIAFLVRGDHELNEVKASKIPGVVSPLQFLRPEEILEAVGCGVGSLGPVGLKIPTVADRSVAAMGSFVCGANREGRHLTGVQFGRDLPIPEVADLRNVVEGDACPDGNGQIAICRGIEVGHIFQLGTKYSAAMGATFLDEAGQAQPLVMGCYGIGVSRIVGAAIEQNYDARGIVFPEPMAPFRVVIVPIGYRKNASVREAAESLARDLEALEVEVLLDDRDERPGVLFADAELIGIPHRLVVSEKHLAQGLVEYQGRRDTESKLMTRNDLIELLCGATAEV